jgi:hypothetical protein
MLTKDSDTEMIGGEHEGVYADGITSDEAQQLEIVYQDDNKVVWYSENWDS